MLSFADARAEQVKAKLLSYADGRCAAMVETTVGVIDASRIVCHDAVAVLIDRHGYQTKLGYDEITDVSPVLPVADIMRLADWQVTAEAPQLEAATVLPFPRL